MLQFLKQLNLQYFQQGDPSCFSPAQEKTSSDKTFVYVITNKYFRTFMEHAQNQTELPLLQETYSR